MSEVLLAFLAFGCGAFVGFVAAAIFAVGSRADEVEEFDGGFRASNPPPARTVIWGGRVEDRHE